MSGSTGAYEVAEGTITINPGKRTLTLTVANTGDRAIQVGSHYHFFEANPALSFDREKAYGMRLAIPSGLAVRFEPGDEKDVELVDFGGQRIMHGFAGLVEGPLDDGAVRGRAMKALHSFLNPADD
ncbi:urease subunit beta [Corynebacterium heidelbergense]|uniref:Urease subunit beta n=1 Tax=Corynebacterium heidelbergense TaxID=2055947 RepID=A0A364V5V0_9CORY|nr:urease subunit beta [Corynebacterium heidelbergense]RAV32022.1 urease subunit beta [Corynebacterium heidelbergense]